MNSIRTPTQVKTSLRGIKPDSNFIMDKKNPKRKTIYLWLIIERQEHKPLTWKKVQQQIKNKIKGELKFASFILLNSN